MPSSDERTPRLVLLNAAAAALYTAVALTILAVHPELRAPVWLTAPGVDAGPFAVVDTALAAAIVVLLSAVVRLAVTLPPVRRGYEAGVGRGRHGVRWLELSQTAGITIVIVGLLNSVSEAGVIVLLYAVATGAVLLLWLQDRQSTPGRRGLAPSSAGAALGLVPWGVYQVTRSLVGEPVPPIVSASTIALLVLASLQWANVWLHHQRRGPGARDAAFERVFVVLAAAHSLTLLVLVLVPS